MMELNDVDAEERPLRSFAKVMAWGAAITAVCLTSSVVVLPLATAALVLERVVKRLRR